MDGRSVAGMLKHLRSVVAVVARRFRSRAVLELENLALHHQLRVLRRQRPGRPRLFAIDRLLWVWLYRLWPRCLDTMMLVNRQRSSSGTGKDFGPIGVGAQGQDERR